VTKSEKDATVGRYILVDGYNVIKQSTSFQTAEAKNLATARELLVTQLVNRYRHTPHQVTVVFDGNETYEQVSHDRRVRIIYSRYGETADSVIVRLAAEARAAGQEVEMYSDDGEVRRAVARQGSEVHTSGQLTDQFNAAPRDVARRARYRQAMYRKYHLHPERDPDDEPEPRRSSRGKKKRRRR